MSKLEALTFRTLILSLLVGYVFVSNSAQANSYRDNWESLKSELAEVSGEKYEPVSLERADKCGLNVMLQHQALSSKLEKNSNRAVSSAFPRPILPEFYDSPSGYFRIHFADTGSDSVFQASIDSHGALGAGLADGVPDYVNDVGDIFDSVMSIMLTDSASGGLGYPTPPTDVFTGSDTDAKYDVFLDNVGGAYFGLTAPEGIRSGYFGVGFSASSFIVLDNDYQENSFQSSASRTGILYRDTPLEAVRVTAAHEFFHAIHFGIEVEEGPVFNGFIQPYWQEMSSVAMEELLYDHVNDYYGYLYSIMPSTPFKTPFRSLQTFGVSAPDADFPYAMGIFGIYLNDKFGKHLTRKVWEGCGKQGPDFLFALDSVLKVHTSGAYDLNSAYAEFGLRLFFTGDRIHLAHDSLRFEEADEYPMIPDNLNDTNSYPVNITFVNGTPSTQDANSVSFTFLKDVFRTTGFLGDCFKAIVNVSDSATVFSGLNTRVTLIGVPRDPLGKAVIASGLDSEPIDLVDDTVAFSTTTEKDSILLWYNEQYPCENQLSATVWTGPTHDSLRIRMRDNRPSAFVSTPTDIDHVAMLVTKTTVDWRQHRDDNVFKSISKYPFQYRVRDSSVALADFNPYSFLTAYPNPITSSDQFVTLRASRDALEFPDGDVTIAITIYTEAGEKVFENSYTDDFRTLEVTWPLTNMSGASVASGVYVVLQQLVTQSGEVSTSETTKILVIR